MFESFWIVGTTENVSWLREKIVDYWIVETNNGTSIFVTNNFFFRFRFECLFCFRFEKDKMQPRISTLNTNRPIEIVLSWMVNFITGHTGVVVFSFQEDRSSFFCYWSWNHPVFEWERVSFKKFYPIGIWKGFFLLMNQK